jgi:predicted flavoprotein YhiN
MSTSDSSNRKRIAVIGGGASGMFAATAAADYVKRNQFDKCEVVVFEGTSRTMSKVRISGGGRVSNM